ncbi:MAG: NUDIX domain-containing protein [Gammaproteobacteria bacterium]|nr:NUDIX domain-containing protein [Gammaproteobacteria bacterium]
MTKPITPLLTADVIIEMPMFDDRPIILIERKYEPYGWAIPGGFVEVGETIASSARREALEETSLDVDLDVLLGIYSNPERDYREHTVCGVFIGNSSGKPVAADDAKDIALFDPFNVDVELAFDHRQILQDYCKYRSEGIILLPE